MVNQSHFIQAQMNPNFLIAIGSFITPHISDPSGKYCIVASGIAAIIAAFSNTPYHFDSLTSFTSKNKG